MFEQEKCGGADFPALMILQVTKELPQLAGHSKEILRRLSVSLIYRRNHKNNTKYWKRAHQVYEHFRFARLFMKFDQHFLVHINIL